MRSDKLGYPLRITLLSNIVTKTLLTKSGVLVCGQVPRMLGLLVQASLLLPSYEAVWGSMGYLRLKA